LALRVAPGLSCAPGVPGARAEANEAFIVGRSP
jgi:hypothetical protein